MISLRSTYLSCALLALFAVPAFCSPVLFTDSSAWLNAVASPPSTVTFENANGDYSTAAGFTTGLSLPDSPTFVGMVLVNGVPGNFLQIVSPSEGSWYDYGSGGSLAWSPLGGLTTSSFLQVTFPSPVTAFAVDLMTYRGGVSYTVTINNDPTVVGPTSLTPGFPNRTFFGLTSDTPISSIDFYLSPTSLETPRLDNFSYSTSLAQAPVDPSDTPELGTFLLIASGLIGMALMGRRLRRDVAQVS